MAAQTNRSAASVTIPKVIADLENLPRRLAASDAANAHAHAVVYLPNTEATRFITYYDIIDIHNCWRVSDDLLELKYKAMKLAGDTDGQGFKVTILTELEKLEAEILRVKGKEREKVMETYRELLGLVGEEPIYLKRYE